MQFRCAFKMVLAGVIAPLLILGIEARAQFKTIYAFKGAPDGLGPSGLVRDSSGKLYGTVSDGGGDRAFGSVFELSPTANGGLTKKTIYRFNDFNSGGLPTGNMVLDPGGNLFGTAIRGGPDDEGVVFELSPSGGNWTETTIHSFHGSDGGQPINLLQDANGNLYGVTGHGGSTGNGVVFELSPTGGGWTETILHDFSGNDGSYPNSLFMDTSGNLFGTTRNGAGSTRQCTAIDGCGTVFELSPQAGGGWNFSYFALDAQHEGILPMSVIEDSSGNLFAAAAAGGGVEDGGTVFELTPVAPGSWVSSILFRFSQDNTATGYNPIELQQDGAGGLYGITQRGGRYGWGTVFRLSPTTTQGIWKETVRHNFSNGYDGYMPNHVLRAADGNIYGTTGPIGQVSQCAAAGMPSCGTVFEIVVPTGAAR